MLLQEHSNQSAQILELTFAYFLKFCCIFLIDTTVNYNFKVTVNCMCTCMCLHKCSCVNLECDIICGLFTYVLVVVPTMMLYVIVNITSISVHYTFSYFYKSPCICIHMHDIQLGFQFAQIITFMDYNSLVHKIWYIIRSLFLTVPIPTKSVQDHNLLCYRRLVLKK